MNTTAPHNYTEANVTRWNSLTASDEHHGTEIVTRNVRAMNVYRDTLIAQREAHTPLTIYSAGVNARNALQVLSQVSGDKATYQALREQAES